MALVVAGVGLGLIVTSACSNVVGLTDYDFVDGAAEGSATGGDARTDGPAPVVDAAPPPADASNVCTGAFAGFPAACASCAESKCCPEAVLCAAVTGCVQRAKNNSCSGNTADLACRNVTKCLKDKCACGG